MSPRHPILFTFALTSCLFLLASTGTHAQSPTSPDKIQHVRQLITILGGVDGLKRNMQDEIATLREKHPSLKKEYWESLTQGMDEKELPVLIDRLGAVYDTLLSDEEVSELLRSYDSPTGTIRSGLLATALTSFCCGSIRIMHRQ